MRFEEMGLREELLRVIQENDYKQPTPIQEQAIPRALEGRDLICCAQTGTGKTAAFALPILQRLAEKERADIRALVLVPTRELAIQVGRSLRDYGKYLELISATAFGGVPIEPQEMMLRHGVDILVATPGRLKDHIWRGNIDFRYTECLVLDEADRMLDMGFIRDVRGIVELLPTARQSMLFSATLDQEIRRFSKDILKDPLRIEVAPPASTLDEVDQFLVRTSRARKHSTLEMLIRGQRMTRTIVFTRTKAGASRLASQLRERGHRASAIHSDRSQEERVRALEGFREGRIHLLVATDIAARGIDIHDVSHVVNYDLPYTAKDYVHRIGRTARAGRRGMAVSLVTPEDSRGVAAIERLISMKLRWLDERGVPASSGRRKPSAAADHQASAASTDLERDHSAGSRDRSAVSSRSGRRSAGRRPGTGREAGRRRRPVTGRETGRRGRGGDRGKAPATGSEQEQRVNSPARRNGKKPAGIVQVIVERLRAGLLAGRR
jgi:ATP-dependent RNA helicase RhlE